MEALKRGRYVKGLGVFGGLEKVVLIHCNYGLTIPWKNCQRNLKNVYFMKSKKGSSFFEKSGPNYF